MSIMFYCEGFGELGEIILVGCDNFFCLDLYFDLVCFNVIDFFCLL